MIALKAETRVIVGKKVSTLRKQGHTPAELYGNEIKNIHLQMNTKELKKAFKEGGKNSIIQLTIDENKKTLPVLIADLVEDPLTNEILTADLRQVSLTEKIQIEVPIRLTGESPATKDGHIVTHVLSHVEVESLPTNIPHEFEISIEKLTKAGDVILAEEIKLPTNVKLITPKDSVIVTIAEHDEKSFETPAIPIETETPENAALEENPDPTKKE